MSPGFLGSSAPSGSYAQRTNRGRVIHILNSELSGPRPASREDRAGLQITYELDEWKGDFRYMFQPRDLVEQLREEREDALLEGICSDLLEGVALEDLHALNVASASEIVCGGTIWTYNSTSKIHITDVWLRRHDKKVLLTLPADDKSEWGFFPGMICAIKGLNPTGNNLLVKELLVPKLPPSPTFMLTDSTPSEVSIIFASGPFTFGDDLVFSPLVDLLEEVKRSVPSFLILSGPFIDLDNEATTPKSHAEIRDELWSYICQHLQDVDTKVLTIPHIRESQHVACFPEPALCFRNPEPQKLDSKVAHLPNPCFLTIGFLKLCVMSHDIIFHLAGNEVSKAAAGTQPNRISKLCSYLLHQRSLYPLALPPPGASMDWTHMKKYNLESPLPDLLFLPSQLGQYVKIVGSCVFVNSGQLVKGKNSPGTFARVVVHSGISPIQERTRVEIVRI